MKKIFAILVTLLVFAACSGTEIGITIDLGDAGTDWLDLDGDGWIGAYDCDDNNPLVYPGQWEIYGDGVDNNCDGVVE